MNKLLLLIFFILSAYAKEIVINNKKFVYFERNTKNLKKTCFYKNGIIDNRNCYKISNSVIISLKNSKFISTLEKKYNLKYFGKIDKNRYVFKTDNPLKTYENIKKDLNLSIEINWIRPRFLK